MLVHLLLDTHESVLLQAAFSACRNLIGDDNAKGMYDELMTEYANAQVRNTLRGLR